MADAAVIPALQAFSGLMWLLPVLIFSRAIGRVWMGRHHTADLLVVPYPIIGIVQVGFSLRWWLYPKAIVFMSHEETTFWAGLYILSGLCALLTLVAGRAWWTR